MIVNNLCLVQDNASFGVLTQIHHKNLTIVNKDCNLYRKVWILKDFHPVENPKNNNFPG